MSSLQLNIMFGVVYLPAAALIHRSVAIFRSLIVILRASPLVPLTKVKVEIDKDKMASESQAVWDSKVKEPIKTIIYTHQILILCHSSNSDQPVSR